MKCPCGYEWEPRVESPKACPECKRRLGRDSGVGRVDPRQASDKGGETFSEALAPTGGAQVGTGHPEQASPVRPRIQIMDEIAEAQKRLEEKRKAVVAAVPAMKPLKDMTLSGTARPVERLRPIVEKPVLPDSRALRDFKKQYARDPESEAELEGFRKRGW